MDTEGLYKTDFINISMINDVAHLKGNSSKVFIANYEGLKILNIYEEEISEEVASYDNPAQEFATAVAGDEEYAYIANNPLRIINYEDFDNLYCAGFCEIPDLNSGKYCLEVNDDLLFLGAQRDFNIYLLE